MDLKSMQRNSKNLHFICSQFHHQQQASTSLISSASLCFITRRIDFPQKISSSPSSRAATSVTVTTTSTAHPLIRTSSLRCSNNDEFQSVDPKAVELDPSLMVKNKAMKISPGLKGTSIFLVGQNCTIKTNLGKGLADALRYYYFDSDSLVEQAGGDECVTKSFRERDEKGFLETETEVLKQLSSMGRLVVCAGDGAVQSSTNLAFLRYGISIWIDIPMPMVAREVKEKGSQCVPVTSDITAKVAAKLTKQYESMKGGYATADATVSLPKIANQLGYDSMDALTIEDMVMEILNEIERLTRVKKMMEAAARPF